jgi:integrase
MRRYRPAGADAAVGQPDPESSLQTGGLDPTLFSAHGLRSGYLTEAANRGIPLPEAMQQSLHKSVSQAASYYNNAERKNGRAARLIV